MILWVLILAKWSVDVAGLKRERYAVRENEPYDVNCNHKLGRVARVKWEYTSTRDNVSTTIYDSQQPNNTLKSGFEVFCQPHEAFISTCKLKLVQARKEDSGNYICYVGEENEAKLKPIIEIELAIKGPKYEVLVITKGDSIVLPCEHNVSNLTRARWSHVSLHGVLTYAIYHLPAKETSNKNYEALCEPHQLSCNLKILQANKESAGRYICMVGESLEFEKKYGLDQMTYFIEIQLVVGEFECNENMNKDITLIGENDCHGIEADVLNLKCSFNYFGNITYDLLHLRWIKKHKFNSLEKKLNSSLIKHEVKDETNKISIQTNLSVAYEMQNSTFQCVLDDTAVKPCQLNFRTQYVKNTTERSPPIYLNDLHNMKCSANKSANVQCSYYWVHEIGGAMVETPYPILPVEHMNSPGIYTCLAKCHLGIQKECIIKAVEVEIILGSEVKVSDASHSINWIIAIAVIILLLITFATCGGCLVFLRWKLKKHKRKYGMEHQFLMQNKSVTGEGKKISKGSKEQEVGKNIEAAAGAKKTHDILLFEWIKNACGAEVFLSPINDLTYRRSMLRILINSHPNPEKVILVIGRQDMGIVEVLMEQTGVKSVTLCENYESQAAFDIKYHQLMKHHLRLGKVKIIIQEHLEFLKAHKEFFDVIINHLSYLQTHQQGTQKGDHNNPAQKIKDSEDKMKEIKEICEASVLALKCGGIMEVNLEVFGENHPDYIIERETVKVCKNIFPVAMHIVSIAQPSFNIGLKSLFCSFNHHTDFKTPILQMSIEKKKQ